MVLGYGAFNEQGYGQSGLKPTPPPVPSPQNVMGPPGITVQQQLMQSVRSPPPIRSPQPNPSPRPVPSPRNQPVPSPRAGPVPSPHHHPAHGGTPTHSPAHDLGGPSEMMLSQLSGGNAASATHPAAIPHHPSPAPPPASSTDATEVPPMTPQDQLSKFVEGL